MIQAMIIKSDSGGSLVYVREDAVTSIAVNGPYVALVVDGKEYNVMFQDATTASMRAKEYAVVCGIRKERPHE